MLRTEVLFSKVSCCSTLQQLLKSNLCAFYGLTSFKVLRKSTQNYSFHPMTLMIRHLSTDKDYVMAGLREKMYFRIHWVKKHIVHIM